MMQKSKRTLYRFLLCFCAVIVALPWSAYADAGINSWQSSENSLAVYDNKVYCLVKGDWIDFSSIFEIADEKAKKIYSQAGIDNIYSYTEGLVLDRSRRGLDDLFVKMASGDKYVEVFDPNAGTIVEWDFHESEPAPNWFVFSDGEAIFVSVCEDDKGTEDIFDDEYALEKYAAPGIRQKVSKMRYTGPESSEFGYPSFCLVEIQRGKLLGNEVNLTLFDYQTGETYSAKTALSLSDNTINRTLHAVLKEKRLYYLSQKSLRVYDFTEDSDEEFFSLTDSPASYKAFILSDEYIIMLGTDGHLIDVYDSETLELSVSFESSVTTIEYLLYNDKLYIYSRYGEKVVECIDLKDCTQKVVSVG